MGAVVMILAGWAEAATIAGRVWESLHGTGWSPQPAHAVGGGDHPVPRGRGCESISEEWMKVWARKNAWWVAPVLVMVVMAALAALSGFVF